MKIVDISKTFIIPTVDLSHDVQFCYGMPSSQQINSVVERKSILIVLVDDRSLYIVKHAICTRAVNHSRPFDVMSRIAVWGIPVTGLPVRERNLVFQSTQKHIEATLKNTTVNPA